MNSFAHFTKFCFEILTEHTPQVGFLQVVHIA